MSRVGLSFEMTVLATDVSVDADVPDGNDSFALREQAAAENAELEVLHWESLQDEIAIAEGAGSRNNLFAGASVRSGSSASDADFLQVLPITESAHDVSVTDGYSADNTFSHADPGWSHKEFNISGSLVFGTTFSILTRPFSVLLTTTSNVLLILFMEMFMKSSNNKLNANRKLQNCMQRSWTMLGMLAS